ncbi:hypothetical protein SARC_06159 [Sphaeroforma arctica JP610]|uniref:BUD13 homolog n=1 Tax=Sphaeroforma arctica JP610 TaxID=667725 RepID=A0A0L0FXH5_9EUKA|nr:hypothetical protein SARC_06159 [Sphaeroforma arctica JP610]KNC81532.1 hypothetical protein SARC_06159 [Sphaeroforma arctica JP610]|eukprot:XP_014155434.1 hypothetical protein SARC_06159 [Sphaeroforma arctica JP610]
MTRLIKALPDEVLFYFPRSSHDSPDLSPPRRTSRKHSPSQSPTKRRHTSHSDSSPPRRRQRQDSSDSSPVRRHQSANDDLSPPRKRRDHSEDLSPPRRSENGIKDGGIGSKVMADGTKAGLVEASMVVEAGRRKKEKEDRDFAKLDEATMGRHAETVRRDKKTGKKIDPKLERLQQRDADNKREAAEHAALRWGKGAVQERTQQQKMEDDIKVMAQPFARTADDKDLNDMLKERHRAEDPMAHLVKKKTKKQLPVYKGAAPPPNRYNIWPGYRWDGVDRGNQFEKKLFTMQADASANAADYLAWATEDM